MIGNMISKIRKEKGVTKTKLANITEINIGHLTHIEKGERNPSHKALKSICSALNIPYSQLLYTYDKKLTEDQKMYDYLDYVSYNTIPAVTKIDEYIPCPAQFPNANFAYKMPDNSMAPILKQDQYVFVEINGLINNKEIGFFCLNGEYLFRRLLYKRGKLMLKAEDENIKDVVISNQDDFKIIGKVYV